MQNDNVAVLSAAKEQGSFIRQAIWISVFAALTAVGAQIEIPHQPVPYTLQTLFVLLSGALLGKRNGAISQVAYLCAGIIGVPVFSGFGFGLARILGPSGGYLLSFPVAAFVVGYLLEQHQNILRAAVAMTVGLFIVFSLGTLQLNFVYYHDWQASFVHGFMIFSWWDVMKLSAAVAMYRQFSPRFSR
jgi:biotin transport system substrate-specific component